MYLFTVCIYVLYFFLKNKTEFPSDISEWQDPEKVVDNTKLASGLTIGNNVNWDSPCDSSTTVTKILSCLFKQNVNSILW